jgi:SAM-dependent methyltransferase
MSPPPPHGIEQFEPSRFIGRWKGASGTERGDAQTFINELCQLIGVDQPHDHREKGLPADEYCFERVVRFRYEDGSTSPGRIDLYRKGSFVLEAKQSTKRQKGGDTYDQLSFMLEAGGSGVAVKERPRAKAVATSWDVLMRSAKRQAEDYARALDEWPPFIIVVDVGHAIEVYADFSQQGKNYAQFPNRNEFRISMDDLQRQEVRDRLRAIWIAPLSLDPAARAAEVTQSIASLLARMTQSLEARAKLDDPTQKAEHAYRISKFLMRCIFAMFAEDIGLLPTGGFLRLIEMYKGRADRFHHAANDFFDKMDKGGHFPAIQADIRRFNGGLFREAITVPITEDELSLLEMAARRDWRNVEPAIFGTLLEQALSDRERASLGAHYTPRAYVERLVVPTIVEPLREDWDIVQSEAIGKFLEGDAPAAREAVKRFHDRLCDTLVLDPACGTGNFLYVALELMKRLEGEVLEFLKELGEPSEPLRTVDPHQFLGIEKNPRAVPIAELVLWIGFIQWWFRTRERAVIQEPILKDFGTIKVADAVLDFDRQELLTDGSGRPVTRIDPEATKLHPITGEVVPDPDARMEVYRYTNPRPAKWPMVDFIVGNPPFIGGKDIRAELGDGYAEALWKSRGKKADSIDFVMYWWDMAATMLRANGTRLRRFGFITTNSITQKFSRRVLEKHLKAPKNPISLLFAVPDHPWVKNNKTIGKRAAVRIAMTVAERGQREGQLAEVIHESRLDTDQPRVELGSIIGRVSPDLTVGADVTTTVALRASEGMASPGVKLHGDGFIITSQRARAFGLGRETGLEGIIREYRNGRDLTSRPRGFMVIDLFGLSEDEVRRRVPAIYQHVLDRVRPERAVNNREIYRSLWWVFGEPRRELRPALAGLPRFIATVETSKHRFFQFLPGSVLPDNKLICIATADAFHLGVLSSRLHVIWALRTGGRLGVGNDPVYAKSRCFDPFPFPEETERNREAICALAEELDALRKRVLEQHAFLKMTELYNVRDKLLKGEPLNEKDRAIREAGSVGVIHELHQHIDRAVADAYGWPADLGEEDILTRLIALNAERAEEERKGFVRWLRPDYQSARFAEGRLDRRDAQLEVDLVGSSTSKPSLPKDDRDLLAELRRMLRGIGRPAEVKNIAVRFRDGGRASRRVERGLQLLAAAGVARRSSQGWFVLNQ